MILVAIVTYNGLKWIDGLLQPFVQDREGIEVAVVDNASTDGTLQLIASQYPFVKLHRRPSNLGFGMANNLLIEQVMADETYSGIYLLNQDASVNPQAIRTLAHFAAEHPDIGLLSPLQIGADGEVESGFAHYLPRHTEQPFTELTFVNAAHWYLPRHTLLRVGLFSPLFAHYGEDVDYANRVKHAGLKIGYMPEVTAYHYRPRQPIPPAKQLHLKHAYHLSEAINPLYSSLKRLYRGLIIPTLEALFATGESRKELWQMTQRLWRLRPTMRLWIHRPSPDLEGLRRCLARESYAPILLLVYNRPHHTRRILQQILSQPEITQTPIYIWSDGAKTPEDSQNVEHVRELCRTTLPQATLYCQPFNVGLARNVVEGVNTILQRHGRVVVVEDDLSLSPYFLRWMNDALDLYADKPQIAHLHTGTFYTSPRLRHNHPLHFAGSWGWATWHDRWATLWEPDGSKLLTELTHQPTLYRRFRYRGQMDFAKMLRRQISGQNDSWAVRWHASLLLHHKLSINTNPPLTTNEGFDNSGTHSGGGGRYHTALSPYPLYADPHTPEREEPQALRILQNYYLRTNNKLVKGWYKLKELWQKYFG